ncbi:MAG: insulinase family protein [Chitinophagaceae bacterium]|nr:insulinase family protein [Oligoflexus sp.]
MQKPLRTGLALALALSAGLPLQSLSAKPSETPKPSASSALSAPVFVTDVEGFKEYQLSNGLKVVLFPDASKPRITVNITYKVGSRHEGNGEAGMAHLLEHMMFKGTPTRPDIWKMLQQQGAQFNASTANDRTNYHEVLPASKDNLEFALSLEADRMINSTIAAEALAKEFSVVRNEFENRENNPANVLNETMFHAAYQWHGYGRTTIGNKSDIEKVPVPKLKEFYQRFYQPDNAVLVVAGAFDEKATLEMINKDFGVIPRPQRTLIGTYTIEPVQEGEREVILRREGEQAVIGAMYHTVAGSDPKGPAIDALVSALTQKPTGLLYKELVVKGLATDVDGGNYGFYDPGVIAFEVKVAKGKDPRELSKKLLALIENLKPNQITEADLRRYKADFERGFELSMTDSARVAIGLTEYIALGDWRLMFLNRDRTMALTLKDVQASSLYMKSSNRTLGLFIPTKNADRVQGLVRGDIDSMVKGYKGHVETEQGEVFNPTFDAIIARTEYSTLPNGMKIALMPKKSRGAPVTLDMDVPVGSAATLKDHLAALHFLPKIMLRGTKKRDYAQFKDDLAVLKAGIHAESSYSIDAPNEISFAFTTVKPKLKLVIDLFAEVLLQPRFDQAQFELAKKETLADLNEERDDPGSLGSRAFTRTLTNYPMTDIRYIPSVDEEIQMVQAMTLADVKKVYSQLLGGSAGRLVMIGDFDPAQVKSQLTQLIGNWKAPVAAEKIVFEPKPAEPGVQTFDTPDKKGANVFMAQSFKLKESDPRFPASRIAGLVWGEGSTSRLINRLRQKDGLSYGAGGSLRADGKSDFGFISATAICAPQNVAKAVAAIREEAARFAKDGITEQELQEAKIAYAERRKGTLNSDNAIMSLIGRNLELGRTLNFNKEIDQKVAALTLDDVNKVIRDLVVPEKFFAIEALDKKAAALPLEVPATALKPAQGS